MSDGDNKSVFSGITERTHISLGVILAVLVFTFAVAQPVVSAFMTRTLSRTERETRVDMTLEEYERRITMVEKNQGEMLKSLRRLERHFGTLPNDDRPR